MAKPRYSGESYLSDQQDEKLARERALSARAFEEAPPYNSSSPRRRRGMSTVQARLIAAKLRARLDKENDGVLGVQSSPGLPLSNSIVRGNRLEDAFTSARTRRRGFRLRPSCRISFAIDEDSDDEVEEDVIVDGSFSFASESNFSRIIKKIELEMHQPKYSLRQVVLSRRFHLYAHRFANAQRKRTLTYPTLPQPEELVLGPDSICRECNDEDENTVTEKLRTREGHRFIIAADTQFGILMDGFAMEYPNWDQELEISRKCVAQINSMKGSERPLFVCVCGDLVDTESSFSGAIARWKNVTSWERDLVFDQQVKDFKRVWSSLDPDIALVCLCGNHDVGNRPTKESIDYWKTSFGDDYLSFWV
ncbi:hypothetical protein ACHAWF_001169, partial [Thalassiosira exigua]